MNNLQQRPLAWWQELEQSHHLCWGIWCLSCSQWSVDDVQRIRCRGQYLKEKHHRKITLYHSLWANSADDKLMIFFLLFSENRIWHFMQIVSTGNNLHKCESCFLGKVRKIFQTVLCWIFLPECQALNIYTMYCMNLNDKIWKYIHLLLTLIIFTSLISNKLLSWSENLVPVLT